MLATTPLARCALGTFAALTALLVAASAHAQVYKCKVDGKTIFSDRPCAADAKPVEIRPASGHTAHVVPPAGEGTPPHTPADDLKARVSEMERARLLRDIDHRIRVEHSLLVRRLRPPELARRQFAIRHIASDCL